MHILHINFYAAIIPLAGHFFVPCFYTITVVVCLEISQSSILKTLWHSFVPVAKYRFYCWSLHSCDLGAVTVRDIDASL